MGGSVPNEQQRAEPMNLSDTDSPTSGLVPNKVLHHQLAWRRAVCTPSALRDGHRIGRRHPGGGPDRPDPEIQGRVRLPASSSRTLGREDKVEPTVRPGYHQPGSCHGRYSGQGVAATVVERRPTWRLHRLLHHIFKTFRSPYSRTVSSPGPYEDNVFEWSRLGATLPAPEPRRRSRHFSWCSSWRPEGPHSNLVELSARQRGHGVMP